MPLDDDLKRPFRQFVDDPIGFLERHADNGQRVPATRTRTSYSLTIHAQVGNRRGVIGAVHELAPRQRLQVDEEFDVDAFAKGLPRELVPQALTGRTLSLRRYDLYTATMEEVFGTPELITLCDQTGPISLRLMTKTPEGGSLVSSLVDLQPRLQVYEFLDCYITDLGKTFSAQNVIVGSDATLVWRNIRRLQ